MTLWINFIKASKNHTFLKKKKKALYLKNLPAKFQIQSAFKSKGQTGWISEVVVK